jgi:hypothetical protein
MIREIVGIALIVNAASVFIVGFFSCKRPIDNDYTGSNNNADNVPKHDANKNRCSNTGDTLLYYNVSI